MNLPPFLIGSVLLFWGWQSQLLWFAIPMAVLLETARWMTWRLDLTDKEFNRLADFTSVLLIITIVYLLSQKSIYGLPTLLVWLPMLFFILIAGQIYSAEGTIKLSSLLLSLRNSPPEYFMTHWQTQRIDLSYPYLLICLLSASASRASGFFMGVCLLIGWALWRTRPQRYARLIWGILLALACSLAYAGYHGLSYLQVQVETLIMSWFEQQFWLDRDPYRQNTAIGDIGSLKQSNRIVMRVKSSQPLLLREASYNTYHKTTWQAKQASFSPVHPSATENTTWVFTPSPPIESAPLANQATIHYPLKHSPFTTIQIAGHLSQGKGILALPLGTYKITHLKAAALQRNNFGAVKVEDGPDLIEYTATVGQTTPLDTPPTSQDEYLATEDRPLFTELANQLNLYQLSRHSPLAAITTIQQFFTQKFHYTLTLSAPSLFSKNALSSTTANPLAYFLHHSRAGHCEYFATSTVLLLRAIGIPSRYATGYAVEEFSDLEAVYLVRKRHAHAWTLAYVNGQWLEIDTTPSNWLEFEEELTEWWQPFYDVWSWLNYHYLKWRWRDSTESSNTWIIGLVIPLMLILIWRVYTQKKVTRSQSSLSTPTQSWSGADSAFYQVIQRLIAAGYGRLPGETLTAWLQRLQANLRLEEIPTMLNLHLRHRFDPQGLSPPEQANLSSLVQKWMAKIDLKSN